MNLSREPADIHYVRLMAEIEHMVICAHWKFNDRLATETEQELQNYLISAINLLAKHVSRHLCSISNSSLLTLSDKFCVQFVAFLYLNQKLIACFAQSLCRLCYLDTYNYVYAIIDQALYN